jgi:hypothetical protein
VLAGAADGAELALQQPDDRPQALDRLADLVDGSPAVPVPGRLEVLDREIGLRERHPPQPGGQGLGAAQPEAQLGAAPARLTALALRPGQDDAEPDRGGRGQGRDN